MEQRQLFAVDGLFCAGCARGLERRLATLDGVADAGVHFVTSSALVRWNADICSVATIRARVADAGYRLVERHDLGETAARFDREIRALSLRLAVAVVFGMWSMGAALILYAQPDLAPGVAWWIALASGVFALPVLCYSGAAVFRMAWRSLRLRAPGLDLMIAIGAGGAALLSVAALARGGAAVFFDTATMLVTLLLVGRLIETRVRRSAILALAAVDDVAAEMALSARDGAPVAARSLAPGDHVLVDAGAVFPIDGVVVAGDSLVDRAVMTGEAAALTVAVGDRVQAGTTNLRRRLTIEVDRPCGDRDIDRMGGRVAIEIAARGEPRRELDRWVRALLIATPIIALVAFVFALMAAASFADAAARALSVLIVICPCALAIAAPLAHVRAAIAGVRQGIRVADPAALEALAAMASVVFDKTGTLTLGRLRIVALEPVAPFSAAELATAAAHAEQGIDHPIARALAGDRPAGAGGERLDRGARGIDPAGRRVAVSAAARSGEDGLTWLDVSIDDAPAGRIALADTIDPDAARTVARLRRAGVAVMLATGDGEGPAASVAEATGIAPADVHAGCTPADKARLVAAASWPVIVVGDGVNDAPALAAADCGITVARAHAAATATAGLVFEEGGVGTMIAAWTLARRTATIIRQNFALALLYNLVALPLAAIGLMTPLIAAAAMLASSLLVTANAMRVR
ncbi:HAD-IC family P-type ATPase [Sphingomonas sp. H39-1-10]|uniref:heavy metal translocating P-type ATPase n=1 Tax=Sphingomonas pollutisoli TaxID=3030829 RepID=UPI0023B9064D|nr:HAD-IC family P-type ATPase [Sphingomonas pollutisoli]MDF0491351.1 HAD-IC family P-type ATPase [Sphingomonas pollutisoli]